MSRPATAPYMGSVGSSSLEATGVSAGPTHSNAGQGSTTDELERLANLRASGAITEQEFEQLKASQLSSPKAG